MRVVETLPQSIRVVENIFIPLKDGSRVAAKLWIPEDAEKNPVPAVMEYIPYRKRDFTARRDSQTHAYVAGHGYAALRVDCRGSGDSDGLMHDEYLKQELEDGGACPPAELLVDTHDQVFRAVCLKQEGLEGARVAEMAPPLPGGDAFGGALLRGGAGEMAEKMGSRCILVSISHCRSPATA